MIAASWLLLLLFAADQELEPPAKAVPVKASTGKPPAAAPTNHPAITFAAAPQDADDEVELPAVQETLAGLAKVRRIYVDILTGGESALKIRDLLMSSIQASRLFIITEEEDKADAILKGAGHDEVFTDVFQSSEGINARSQISLGAGNSSSGTTSSNRRDVGIGMGQNESRKTEERKHEAMATVRLVNRDGDVIWSDTEESLGAKFVGASVDVAGKITKKLVADYRRAKIEAKGGRVVIPN